MGHVNERSHRAKVRVKPLKWGIMAVKERVHYTMFSRCLFGCEQTQQQMMEGG